VTGESDSIIESIKGRWFSVEFYVSIDGVAKKGSGDVVSPHVLCLHVADLDSYIPNWPVASVAELMGKISSEVS